MSRTLEQIDASIAVAERAHAEGRHPTHREMYPEQYEHPRIGQNVKVFIKGEVKAEGTITRVINSRFGTLAEIDNNAQTFWSIFDCKATD